MSFGKAASVQRESVRIARRRSAKRQYLPGMPASPAVQRRQLRAASRQSCGDAARRFHPASEPRALRVLRGRVDHQRARREDRPSGGRRRRARGWRAPQVQLFRGSGSGSRPRRRQAVARIIREGQPFHAPAPGLGGDFPGRRKSVPGGCGRNILFSHAPENPLPIPAPRDQCCPSRIIRASVRRCQRSVLPSMSMKRRNSARVLASARNVPSMLLVIMETPRLWTPRVVMH